MTNYTTIPAVFCSATCPPQEREDDVVQYAEVTVMRRMCDGETVLTPKPRTNNAAATASPVYTSTDHTFVVVPARPPCRRTADS